MRKTLYNTFFALLFSPVLAYFYMVVFKLPKSILHLFTFIFFILGLIFIIREKIKNIPRFSWFLLIYAIYRIIWLQYSNIDYHPLTQLYYSILYFSTFLLIIIIYNTHFSFSFISKSKRLISFTIILASIASIIQVFDQNFLNAWDIFKFEMNENIYQFRRSSIFGYVNTNALGLSYIPLGCVYIGYLLKSKKGGIIIFTLLIGITAFLSNARYIMVSFIILTMQYLIYRKIRFQTIIKYISYIIISSILIYFTMKSMGYDPIKFYNERLFSEGSIEETTRYKAIDNFIYFFPKNTWLGTGVHLTDEIKKASYHIGSSQIHIGYLSHLISYGIVGSFFLFGFWFSLARYLYKNARKTKYWGSFFAYLTFFWAQATLVYYPIFFTGLIFALIFDKYFQDQYIISKLHATELSGKNS